MKLRIGTRRSRLAMAQSGEVAVRLDVMGVDSELVPIETSGDRGASARSSPAGIKGLFVAEIVRALREGSVDLAVHSAKDLPGDDPEGVVVAAVPERADPFDVLVTRGEQVPRGAVVGTSSLRRRAQLLRSRPDLRIEDIRGNVETRLRKLEEGLVDGLVLAAAGLGRLGIEPPWAVPLPLDEMVPAPGQGALAVQARVADEPVLEVCRRLEHERSRLAFEAERGVMVRLGGGCALPLGAYAERREGGVRLLTVVVRPVRRSEVLLGKYLGLCLLAARNTVVAAVAEEVAGILRAAGADAILAEVRG